MHAQAAALRLLIHLPVGYFEHKANIKAECTDNNLILKLWLPAPIHDLSDP
jgi:hypothetical protein